MREITDIKSIPQELIVNIEKLSNLGLGIAKVNNYVIFVKNTCPGDKIKIRITKKNKNYANAVVTEIMEPSKHRIKPICPMHSVCGSCQLQFIDYNYQLELKKSIVADTIHSISRQNIEIKNVIPSPEINEYRHKVQYPVSQTKNSQRLIAGYYKTSSHELVNIKYCPIQPAYCDNIIEYIRTVAKEYNISGYNEKKHSGDLRHVVIRYSHYNKKALVILVINSKKVLTSIKNFANKMFNEMEDITGIAVNLNYQKTNLILGEKTYLLEGNGYIEEKLCDYTFKIGAETFFQVNPTSANNIFLYVKKYILKNYNKPTILDAYAGISAFGICLSDSVKKVVCVEEVKASTELASKIIKENKINNVEIHNMEASSFFEKEINTKRRCFDITIVDPPRKGCTKESLDYILKLTKSKIIYVSCNPATLARDLKYLIDKGCKIDYIQPFDMFPHTYHIENVALINI